MSKIYKQYYSRIENYSEKKLDIEKEIDRRVGELRNNYTEESLSYDRALDIVLDEDPKIASLYVKGYFKEPGRVKKSYTEVECQDAMTELTRLAEITMLEENKSAFILISNHSESREAST